MSEYIATHIIQVGVPQIKTLDDIGLLSTNSTKLTLSKAVRPGTFDHTSSPPVSSIIESTVDGMPYWIDSGGTPNALGTVAGSWQPLDADLTAIAGLTSSSNTAPYFTGSGTAALMTVTTAARTLLDDADTSAMRTTLGLVIGTNVQAYDADLTSLAAATGTNTIYYRSASDTWSAVTVGSGLTFSGGTLDAAGGAATWGAIVGTLADQTDLQAELDALQPLDAELTAFAGLTSASDTAPYFTGSGTAALMTVTGAARDLLDDADAAAMRTTLGVVIGTNVQAYDAGLSALGALSTTDKIYYLSAADTWTAVTIGSGLTFSTGTLSASGGGSGDLQDAYDASTSTEITTDATRGAMTFKRGSAADTDNIIEGKNAAGSTTFSVTGNGAGTFADKLIGEKNIIVGTAAISTSATDGFIYLGSCAGKPTGTPTTETGRVPLVYDSTNLVFWAYSGGAWKVAGADSSAFECPLGGEIADATYTMVAYATFPFNIVGIYGLKHTSGSSTLAVKINGTAVTGLGALSVTSTPQNVTASAANAVAIGDAVNFVISSGSTPVDLLSTLKIVRTG